jgi:hypothetical protein
MCKVGQRCAADIKTNAINAVTAYRANPSPEARNAMVLAVLDYDATPRGIKELQAKASNPSLSPEMREKARKRAVAGQKHREAVKRQQMITSWMQRDAGMDSKWLGDEKYRPDVNNPMVALAFTVAVNAHKFMSRKSGEPYVNHPLRVAQRIQDAGFDQEVVAIALLHDAVEDSALTLSDLKAMRFSPRVISGVDSVTKRDGETYPEAVARASMHPDGKLVKLSDNLDNSSPEQLLAFSEEKRQKQIRKYAPARVTLLQAITGGSLMEPHAVFTKSYRLRMSLPAGTIAA